MNAHLQQEQIEWQYYHVEVEKKGDKYVADATHPMLEHIGIYQLPVKIENKKVIMTKFDLQAITEMIKLEHGNVIIKK